MYIGADMKYGFDTWDKNVQFLIEYILISLLTLIAKFIRTNIWSMSRLKLAISFRPSKVGSIINFALPMLNSGTSVKQHKTYETT